ncbi:hypothetical protein CTM62_07735 [Prevotella intermedia]|uniref:Uncharacterized protein n=1 Tax=Prevotella intermedia TaxID=28131 RepID=A0A2D3L7R1_PREIN|nr:hypothetical protein CTM62_07735 [Prevotella intermedia]
MHGKSGSFASQNLRFRNAKSKLSFSFRIIFTKSKIYSKHLIYYFPNTCTAFSWVEKRDKPLPYTFNPPFQQKITKNISKLFVLLNKKQYLCKYGV